MRLDGARIDTLSPEAMRRIRGKRIGMVFQDPLTSLNPLYRIGEQLIETIETHTNLSGRRGAQARDRAADRGRHSRRRKSASTTIRTSFPAACANAWSWRWRSPPVRELVIADEPTTALDVSVQAQIIALLKRLCHEHGTAIMLITHDMGVIAETADRVAVMYAGPHRRDRRGARRRHQAAASLFRRPDGLDPALDADRDRLAAQSPARCRGSTAIPSGCAFHPRCTQAFAPAQRGAPSSAAHGQSRVAAGSTIRRRQREARRQ